MSRPTLFFIFVLLLLLSSVEATSGSRPIGAKPEDYTTFKPKIVKGKHGKEEVEGCLPKGGRRSSAPSRYINYQPLGSTICSTSVHHQVKNP